MTTLLDIGNELARARRAQGISQRELGDRLGVRQQQVARWEASGYRGASLGRVDAVAHVLGLDLSDSPRGTLPIAAETPAAYRTERESAVGIPPVRDLGEIAARIRANGGVFRDRFGINRIGVFGSFAHGEQTPESDVDLLVDFQEKPKGFAYIDIGVFAEEVLGRPVDYVEAQLLHERLQGRVLGDVVYVWST